jgi:endonuclease III-like uncharacterized protein
MVDPEFTKELLRGYEKRLDENIGNVRKDVGRVERLVEKAMGDREAAQKEMNSELIKYGKQHTRHRIHITGLWAYIGLITTAIAAVLSKVFF